MESIKNIIDQAFGLYMPQVESEITMLAVIVKQKLEHAERPIIYEIGTKNGGTFYIWNSLVHDQNGLCVSIDMSDGGKHGGISEEAMKKRNQWFHERFDQERCHFVLGNSHDTDTVQKAVSIGNQYNQTHIDSVEPFIDFLFIDGDHTYEGVKQDFELYSGYVKDNGLIAFHDIVNSERHRQRDVFVAKFWRELTDDVIAPDNKCMYNDVMYQFKEIYGDIKQDWAGIGLVKKLPS